MKKFEAPEVTVIPFSKKDVLTTSTEHDNGYIDWGDFKLVKQLTSNS